MKRTLDLIFSLIGLFLLAPMFLVLIVIISLESAGGPFYSQERIGKNGVPFKLFKFRSMKLNSDRAGLITVGAHDSRITKSGRFIRKFKLDEFPQLFNVLTGEMSIVGPRPEVAKYVALYTPEQKKVLTVLPGLTDYASLEYFDENELLAESEDPEKTYIEEVLPEKIRLNLKYIEDQSTSTDLKIILKTLGKIIA